MTQRSTPAATRARSSGSSPVFLVGAQRSGTTALGYALSRAFAAAGGRFTGALVLGDGHLVLGAALDVVEEGRGEDATRTAACVGDVQDPSRGVTRHLHLPFS